MAVMTATAQVTPCALGCLSCRKPELYLAGDHMIPVILVCRTLERKCSARSSDIKWTRSEEHRAPVEVVLGPLGCVYGQLRLPLPPCLAWLGLALQELALERDHRGKLCP